jgi:hypothetical protein
LLLTSGLSPASATSSTGPFEIITARSTTFCSSRLVIHADGTIAAVYFDFVFNVDGKANNRGSETWQLVKADNGWRIASIIYSSEPPVRQ